MDSLRVISEDHSDMWRLATSLAQIADDIDAGAPVDPIFFHSVFDYIEVFIDCSHHRKEDEFLYRLMRSRSDHVAEVLDPLQADHLQGPSRLRTLRACADAAAGSRLNAKAFTSALRVYFDELKTHIRAEDRHALPLAREVLIKEDWVEIDSAFSDTESPLFGEKAKSELRELFHRIASLAPESIGLGGHAAGRLQIASAGADATPLLRVLDLESCYGRIKALKGVSIEVHRGETVALVGANGAGKSTFLRALSGVQPVSAGSIFFGGEEISRLRSDMRVRRGICQSPEGRQVFNPLSIEDNLRLGAYTQPKGQVEADLDRIFAMFPVLKEKRIFPAGNLSGGQQQMLAIGRALMGRPTLLLLDEPSMGLAPLLVQEVFNVIRTLKAQGMTILLVEQNAFAALAIADRGYVMENGYVTLNGTGQELINNEEVRAAYLGM